MKLQTKLSALRKCERRAKEAEDSFEDYAGSVGLPDCPITIDRSQNRFSRQADRLEASILKDFERMEQWNHAHAKAAWLAAKSEQWRIFEEWAIRK